MTMVALVANQAAAQTSKSTEAAKPTVAVFRLAGSVSEAPSDEGFPFGGAKAIGLRDLILRLEKAQCDKNVKAVVLTLGSFSPGRAQTEELRQALSQLRAAGKDIYAHADSLSFPDYVLLSGCTQISVVPTGDVWLIGLHGESPYLRGLLNKIGVTPDFLTCGAYKSAAETFMREGPSPQAEEMTNWLLDSIYDTSVRLIARGRGVDPAKVRQWIDDGPYTARRAHEVGLIDAVQHRQEFEAGIKQRFDGNAKLDSRYGEKSGPKIDFSSPMGILSFYGDLLGGATKAKTHGPSVAIVYVEGPIMLGGRERSLFSSGSGVAASTPIRKALERGGPTTTRSKLVVLRVDSPGGSATASDIIYNATLRVKAKKPLVISMGDVAGSGGYYVACGSDTIFADNSTITGSIGVVGGKMATSHMWNKVGINWKEYGRGANASLLSSAHPFTPEEKVRMQGWMDEIYGVFKGHVTAIRGERLKKPIDELAGGRVYTGRQALELGLVDKIGTLEDALHFAAGQAKIEKYEVRVVPEPKNFMEQLMSGANGDPEASESISARTSRIAQPSLLNAALPYLQVLDPERVGSVLRALEQLEIISHEGVVLMTPLVSGSTDWPIPLRARSQFCLNVIAARGSAVRSPARVVQCEAGTDVEAEPG